MKYFKFWVKESFKISVGDTEESINVLSGSNISKEDALFRAEQPSQLIEERINSGECKSDYEAPIKEHVERIVDDSNIITICRYGAKILNTCQYTVLDLDDYVFDITDIFRSVKKLPKKERIVFKFLEKLRKHPELGSDFRIYETAKGIRVIGKKYINPTEPKHKSLMKKFAVDWLYLVLSEKQNCYRARVTPKPYRMKAKTIKIRSPLDCESQEYLEWVSEYESVMERYSVVKLVKSVGKDFSNEPVIKLHDHLCNAYKNNTLA